MTPTLWLVTVRIVDSESTEPYTTPEAVLEAVRRAFDSDWTRSVCAQAYAPHDSGKMEPVGPPELYYQPFPGSEPVRE